MPYTVTQTNSLLGAPPQLLLTARGGGGGGGGALVRARAPCRGRAWRQPRMELRGGVLSDTLRPSESLDRLASSWDGSAAIAFPSSRAGGAPLCACGWRQPQPDHALHAGPRGRGRQRPARAASASRGQHAAPEPGAHRDGHLPLEAHAHG
jgi:hypothetical protein